MWWRDPARFVMRDVDTGTGGTGGAAAQGGDQGTAGAALAPAAFDWKTAGLDAESMALVTDRQWKSVGDALTSYRHLEKLTGVPPERLIRLPSDKDGADAWNTVYDRMGRPKAATDYKIPLPQGDNGSFAKIVSPIFHEAGLSQAQVQKIAEKFNAYTAAERAQQLETAKASDAAAVKELETAWGANYKANIDTVDRAANQFGMTREHVLALKQAMGGKAAMEFLYNVGSKVATEGQYVEGQASGANVGAYTPETAKAKLGELRKDSDFIAQYNSNDPKVRGDARRQMEALNKIAFPEMLTF